MEMDLVNYNAFEYWVFGGWWFRQVRLNSSHEILQAKGGYHLTLLGETIVSS